MGIEEQMLGVAACTECIGTNLYMFPKFDV